MGSYGSSYKLNGKEVGTMSDKVNGVKVSCFEGNFYVRLHDYEELLIELQATIHEMEELKNADTEHRK